MKPYTKPRNYEDGIQAASRFINYDNSYNSQVAPVKVSPTPIYSDSYQKVSVEPVKWNPSANYPAYFTAENSYY